MQAFLPVVRALSSSRNALSRSPVNAMASAKESHLSSGCEPCRRSPPRAAMPALSVAICFGNLAFPDQCLAICQRRHQCPQHGHVILSTQPLTFFGALPNVLVSAAMIELVRSIG